MAKKCRFGLPIIILILICLPSFNLGAQSPEFQTIEEMHSAFVKNEERISSKSNSIGRVKDRENAKTREISKFQPTYLSAAKDASEANEVVETACKKLLANLVMESYSFEVTEI